MLRAFDLTGFTYQHQVVIPKPSKTINAKTLFANRGYPRNRRARLPNSFDCALLEFETAGPLRRYIVPLNVDKHIRHHGKRGEDKWLHALCSVGARLKVTSGAR